MTPIHSSGTTRSMVSIWLPPLLRHAFCARADNDISVFDAMASASSTRFSASRSMRMSVDNPVQRRANEFDSLTVHLKSDRCADELQAQVDISDHLEAFDLQQRAQSELLAIHRMVPVTRHNVVAVDVILQRIGPCALFESFFQVWLTKATQHSSSVEIKVMLAVSLRVTSSVSFSLIKLVALSNPTILTGRFRDLKISRRSPSVMKMADLSDER